MTSLALNNWALLVNWSIVSFSFISAGHILRLSKKAKIRTSNTAYVSNLIQLNFKSSTGISLGPVYM